MIIYLLIFFFFSSRRRHTRLTCDWSSDVCSSDLVKNTPRMVLWKCSPGMVPGGLHLTGRRLCEKKHNFDVSRDRKSTRLNSSHMSISYAVFCLKKKK